MDTSFSKHIISLHAVPRAFVIGTCLVSTILVSLFWLGWPIWEVAVLILLAWLPIFLLKTTSIYHQYGWLAFFFVLVVTQGVHFFEHVAQMIQIHLLGLSGLQARGILGMLDIEWVHFIWNSWVLLCAVLLLFVFRANAWLWALCAFSLWHEIEHIAIMAVFLKTGHPGPPGLLAQGGLIGGGLPVTRPDLHFVYNLIEEVLLMLAYFSQIKFLQSAQQAHVLNVGAAEER